MHPNDANKPLDKNFVRQICDAIERVDATAEIILYGSRARGDADLESDYDLLVLTDGKVSLAREDNFRRELYPLELKTGAVITVILVSKKAWNSCIYSAMPFYQNVQRDGVRL